MSSFVHGPVGVHGLMGWVFTPTAWWVGVVMPPWYHGVTCENDRGAGGAER